TTFFAKQLRSTSARRAADTREPASGAFADGARSPSVRTRSTSKGSDRGQASPRTRSTALTKGSPVENTTDPANERKSSDSSEPGSAPGLAAPGRTSPVIRRDVTDCGDGVREQGTWSRQSSDRRNIRPPMKSQYCSRASQSESAEGPS